MHLEYYVTLFNEDIYNFYGRTYKSNPISLKESSSGMLMTNQQEFIFLITNYVTQTTKAIVEVVLVRKPAPGVTGDPLYSSVGFSYVNIFSGATGD